MAALLVCNSRTGNELSENVILMRENIESNGVLRR
jgi:hypothetical protein